MYDYQKLRISLDNRIRAGNYIESEHSVFKNHFTRFENLEKEMLKYIRDLLKAYEIWEWLEEIKGVGPTIAGVIISEIDIHKADTVSALWRFCGLDVIDGHAPRPVKGQKHTYNGFLRSKLLGVLGSSFLKCNSIYRDFYDNYKNRLETKGWGKSKGHRHNAAIRYMIKMFLRDLYVAWRTLEGLPVREPYQEEYLGKRHTA